MEPQIPNRRGRPLKRLSGMTEADFYRELAKGSGNLPIETVRDVYLGLVKLITQKVKHGGGLTLPHFGKFTRKTRKETYAYDINTGGKVHVPPTKNIKFKSDENLFNYLNGKME